MTSITPKQDVILSVRSEDEIACQNRHLASYFPAKLLQIQQPMVAFGGLALNGTAIESFLQSGQTFFKVYSIERQIASRFDLPGCFMEHAVPNVNVPRFQAVALQLRWFCQSFIEN